MSKFSFIVDFLKLNKKRTVLRQISLLAAIVVMLILAVFAWFTSGTGEATAEGIKVSMFTGNNLDISLDGGKNYVGDIDLLSTDDQEYISDENKIKGVLSMEDITSDGYNFFLPVFLPDANNIRKPDTTEDWEDAANSAKNRAYISQEIIFRTGSASHIYIGSGTRIITSAENEGKLLVSSNPEEIGNISPNGNFSRDCIVGALRISAVDSNDNMCFVMIPRTDVEFVQNDTSFSVKTNENVSSNVFDHYYYSTNYQSEGAPVKLDESKVVHANTPSTDGTIAKIGTTTLNKNDGFYYTTATINIWVEGCDAEARRALSGGKFNIVLDFMAVEN